ncbi:hypothetical protein PQX77_005788 [Marasmius sp. AFHP31]|nr:hypothetical protein PQX77_005788 [Marasmius sp. AFHP31]
MQDRQEAALGRDVVGMTHRTIVEWLKGGSSSPEWAEDASEVPPLAPNHRAAPTPTRLSSGSELCEALLMGFTSSEHSLARPRAWAQARKTLSMAASEEANLSSWYTGRAAPRTISDKELDFSPQKMLASRRFLVFSSHLVTVDNLQRFRNNVPGVKLGRLTPSRDISDHDRPVKEQASVAGLASGENSSSGGGFYA